jgi:TolB protein
MFLHTTSSAQPAPIGLFAEQRDIGAVRQAGSVEYDPSQKAYVVAGGGENMWFTNDAFHFVWNKTSGDLTLAADIEWLGTGGNAHRKACLLIRQGLEPGAPYADVAVHGNGLTSLQFREALNGPTHEIQCNISGPKRVRIERQNGSVSVSVAPEGQELQPSGCSFRIAFSDPVYVGLGVCAHDNGVLEKARFANVILTSTQSSAAGKMALRSTLEVVPIASKDRKVVYHSRDHFEAPNWSKDGKYFLFNSKGRIFKLPVTGGVPELVNTDFANRCNNDHGLSPDGTVLAISDQSQGGKSLIYTVPVAGGVPHRVTVVGPSYWHGWSPDGKTLVFCGERNKEFDVYAIPAEGGEETRLTTAAGLDDGPEYSPDGRYIYFNSDRTGTMQIWRMKPDGSQQEQVTSDEYNNWFAHPSPDGRWLVFLSYDKSVQGHPENKDVMLRMRPLAGGPIQVLAKLFGGQGTINVPSWSPDSRSIAFVSYSLEVP